MKLSTILAPMVAAGVDAATILKTVEAWEAEQSDALERRRESDRERQARKRASHVTSRDVTVTVRDTPHAPLSPDKENPPAPPKEINPTPPLPPGRPPTDFDEFWRVYPNKVGKADAVKAFSKALTRTDLQTLMAGLDRYVAKTDDRPWCNPSTWLNQGRWDDRPATVQPMARGSPAQPQRIPQLADIARFYGEAQNGREADEGFGGAGAVVSYLPAVGSR